MLRSVILLLLLTIATATARGAGVQDYNADATTLTPELSNARRHENNFEHSAARRAYERAIASIEAREGVFAEALIEPLLGLGRAQHNLQLSDAAEASFRRAQHIVHRVKGVHALAQLEAVEHLIGVDVALGKHMDADRQQRFALYVAQHNYGPDDPALVPKLESLARWYEETGQYALARKSHQRIVDIIRSAGTAVDVALIEPLLAIMKTRRLQNGSCCSRKELRDLSEILDTSRDLSPERKASALLALGDNFTALGRPGRAADYYRQAWDLLESRDRTAEFSEPRQLAMFRRITSARHVNQAIDGASFRRRTGVLTRERLIRNPGALEDFLRAEGATDQELQELEMLPPQFFVVPLASRQYNTRIRDSVAAVDGGPRTLPMIGEPIQFVHNQLRQTLPTRLQSDESLGDISISLQFTVGPEGQVRRVKVQDSNAPVRLNQMMRSVVSRTRFRPRVVDGAFVPTEGVRITQTFRTVPGQPDTQGNSSRPISFDAR